MGNVCGALNVGSDGVQPLPSPEAVDAAMQKFAQFDKDESGQIDAKEASGLKRLFNIKDLDIRVVDGFIDRAEFLAAYLPCDINVAAAAIENNVDRRALAARLDSEVGSAMEKFATFDKDGSGAIDQSELNDLKDQAQK